MKAERGSTGKFSIVSIVLAVLLIAVSAGIFISCGGGGGGKSVDDGGGSSGYEYTAEERADWSKEALQFLSTAQIEIISASSQKLNKINETASILELKFKESFPFGVESEIGITFLPGQTSSPFPSFTSFKNIIGPADSAEDVYEFELSFSVPYSELPTEVVELLRATPSSSAASVESSNDTLWVSEKAVLKSGGKKALEKLVEEYGGDNTAVKAANNLLDIINAWKKSEEYKKIMDQLDALEECAKNPPMPNTPPEEIQKNLDKIKETRDNITMRTAVQFLNILASKATSLTPVRIFWPLIASMKAKMESTLKSFNSDDLETLKKSIDCKKTRSWMGTTKCTMDVDGQVIWKSTATVTFEESTDIDRNTGGIMHYVKEGTATYNIFSFTDTDDDCTFTPAAAQVTVPLSSSDGYLAINYPNASYIGRGYSPGELYYTVCCPNTGCFTGSYPEYWFEADKELHFFDLKANAFSDTYSSEGISCSWQFFKENVQ